MEQNAVEILECNVQGIHCIGADVYEVRLVLPDAAEAAFHAGQYLLLAAREGEFSPFSIASAPAELPLLRLHIQARELMPVRLLASLQQHGVARVQMPQGNVQVDLAGDERPLLLIAGGTGMSQMHSILEQARHQGCTRPIHLYWGGRELTDFYRLSAWRQWEQMPNVKLHKELSGDPEDEERGGTLLYEAVIRDLPDLTDFQVVASGSPAMVYATLDALVEHGMQPEQMQADAFSYAPRESTE